MRKEQALTLLLVALAVLFGNHLVYRQLEGARLDLTEDELYSLTDGSRAILERMKREGVKPVDVDLYFSATTGKTLPRFIKSFITYERYLRSLLREYEREAEGKIRVRFIDPLPDSDEAQDALDFGLDGRPVNQEGDLFFFGIVMRTQTGSRDVIEFLWPDRQETVEYEISKRLHALLWPTGKTIGVLAGVEAFGTAENPYLAQMLAAQGRAPREQWVALQLLEESYRVERIDGEVDHISPEEYDLLVVLHPKGLSTKTLWAVDEWVVRGGNALVLVDPYALDDQPPANPQQPWQAIQYRRSSTLGELFEAWGLEFDEDRFAADFELAARRAVSARGPAESVIVDLVVDGSTQDDVLATDHPVLQGLERLRFFLPGVLKPLAAAEDDGEETGSDSRNAVALTPLVTTTAAGSTLTIEPGIGGAGGLHYTDLNDVARLRDRFSPGTEPVVLAYQLTGRLPSAFPEGADFPAVTPERPPGLPPGIELPPPDDAEMVHRDPVPEEERGEATVLVFADVDFVADAIAFQRNFLGLVLTANDNHKLLLNAVDYLLGASELMGVRGKHAVRRPFTLFDDIEAEAEKETLERERQLRADIEAAEEELQEKQRETSGRNAALFQKQLQDEVERLNQRVREGNRELREIRLSRRRALEREEARVRRAVLGWMPSLVLAAGVLLAARRRLRHRRSVEEGRP